VSVADAASQTDATEVVVQPKVEEPTDQPVATVPQVADKVLQGRLVAPLKKSFARPLPCVPS